ncbi:MAG TPA: PilT/PilU family type 4a pilus ATPase [Candidatus Omnitrophota bacterium]|nr:PilT/PilU family type 4a pilus ATPase [Candidatus Omnitrophota bacterium]
MEKVAYLKLCLEKVIEQKGQDVFLKAGVEPRMRIGSQVTSLPLRAISETDLFELASELLTASQKKLLEANKSVDFGYSFHEKDCRFRGNAFYQQGCLSMVFRLLWKGIPTFEELHLPPILRKVALEKSGIILIGGAVSSGKTTTVAAMVRAMNESVHKHIISIEDPVEFLHADQKCLIQQREIGQDTESFHSALKYVVRQSPDVVVIGEMRDTESFQFALAAAEVGRLVISTIHAQSVTQVFDRILGFFRREGEREGILRHFSANMLCLAVQKLLVTKNEKGLVPAVEILIGNYTTRQLVQEHKIDKLPQAIRNAHQEGMQTMDQSLLKLWEAQFITKEAGIDASTSPQELESLMKGIRIGQETKILGT